MKISKKIFHENILLVGFPGNGLVGTFTISYLIHNLDMEQIGEIEHPDIPPTLFIEDGEILPPIRIYKKDNIFVIILSFLYILIGGNISPSSINNVGGISGCSISPI